MKEKQLYSISNWKSFYVDSVDKVMIILLNIMKKPCRNLQLQHCCTTDHADSTQLKLNSTQLSQIWTAWAFYINIPIIIIPETYHLCHIFYTYIKIVHVAQNTW